MGLKGDVEETRVHHLTVGEVRILIGWARYVIESFGPDALSEEEQELFDYLRGRQAAWE